jgi:hypothetical protein
MVKGMPKQYTDPDIAFAYFAGYDDAGDLFVDGLDAGYAFHISGSSGTLHAVALSASCAVLRFAITRSGRPLARRLTPQREIGAEAS